MATASVVWQQLRRSISGARKEALRAVGIRALASLLGDEGSRAEAEIALHAVETRKIPVHRVLILAVCAKFGLGAGAAGAAVASAGDTIDLD